MYCANCCVGLGLHLPGFAAMIDPILAASIAKTVRMLGIIVLPVAILAWFIGWLRDKWR